MAGPDRAYTRQHYVPQFLLRQWHSAPDSMLSVYQSIGGQFLHKRRTAQTVGFQRHLYSSFDDSGRADTRIEREFMGPFVDQPAALVHRKLLNMGVPALNEEDGGHWAQFLVSLMLRTPEAIANIHERARTIFGKILDDDPDFLKEVHPDLTSREVVDKHAPWVYSQLAMRTLPAVIQSEKLIKAITGVRWATRSMQSRCRYSLLIGDRPLIYHGTLDTAFLMVLPLSPGTLFAAFDNARTWENLAKLTDEALVKRVNLDSVSNAARYLFATDDRQSAFIGKHLRSVGSAHQGSKP